MKLENLYKEIKINKPINKKELLNSFIYNHTSLLITLSQFSSTNEFINEYGNTSVEEILEDEWGYENIKEIAQYVENFYIYLAKDIDANWIRDGYNNVFTDGDKFKTIIISDIDGDFYMVRHNL
jgi:hypothetical protein